MTLLFRQALVQAVWGYHYAGYAHTVVSHIHRLRTKLADDTVWWLCLKPGQGGLSLELKRV